MAVVMGYDNKPLVGRLVYLPYTPQKCGIITEDFGGEVQWIDIKGETHRNPLMDLRDYEALIEDHRLKYIRHMKVATKLRAQGV